jgi:hypothetical protein
VAEAKTKATKASVAGFLKRATEGERRADSKTLIDMMTEATGAPAAMWGTAIVGFGTYESQYADGRTVNRQSSASRPRKAAPHALHRRSAMGLEALLGKLGKHKMSGGCVASVAATNVK